MLTIMPNEFVRPSIVVEELKQPDGSYVIGRQAWTAIKFVCDLGDYHDLENNIDQLTIIYGPESWRFFDVRLAMEPGYQEKNNKYVAVFDKCIKIT